MLFNRTLVRTPVVVFVLALVFGSSGLAFRSFNDVGDAWEKASTMKKFIGMGDLPHAVEAGNDSLSSIEKAIDKEEDSSRKDKLRDAQKYVREAIGYAQKDERSYAQYADGAIDKAIAILGELM